MSLRAAIRANVTATRRDLAPAADRARIAETARSYFDLALKLLAPPKPIIVGIGGLSGTGKSVLARSLASHLPPLPGALVLRSDAERKNLFDVAEHDRLPPEAYQEEVSERVYGVLYDKAERVARSGYSVIVDAVFAKAHERSALEKIAAAAQVQNRGLFLTADLETRLRRVGARGPDASDADTEVARQQEQYAVGSVGWTIVDASGAPEETLARARAAIGENSRP